MIARGGSSDMPIPLRRPYSLGNGSGVAVSATRGSEVSAFAPSSDSRGTACCYPHLVCEVPIDIWFYRYLTCIGLHYEFAVYALVAWA